jgi:hypothetical protein
MTRILCITAFVLSAFGSLAQAQEDPATKLIIEAAKGIFDAIQTYTTHSDAAVKILVDGKRPDARSSANEKWAEQLTAKAAEIGKIPTPTLETLNNTVLNPKNLLNRDANIRNAELAKADAFANRQDARIAAAGSTIAELNELSKRADAANQSLIALQKALEQVPVVPLTSELRDRYWHDIVLVLLPEVAKVRSAVSERTKAVQAAKTDMETKMKNFKGNMQSIRQLK